MAVDLHRLRNLAEQLRARSAPPVNQRTGRSWYRINNATGSTAPAEVYLFDMIGEWGITAHDFVGDLRAVTAPQIDLHVNCEGGEVFDGIAIYESLRQHRATVTAHIDGIAASAASFIVQAADRRVMAPNARMMIHDAHGLVIGNAADMREMAGLLDDLSDNIASIYADRAGGTVAAWRQAMRGPSGAADGTWYSGQTAVDAGLADEVAARRRDASADPAGDRAAAAQMSAAADVSTWDPNALAAALREATEAPQPEPVLDWKPAEFAQLMREVAA